MSTASMTRSPGTSPESGACMTTASSVIRICACAKPGTSCTGQLKPDTSSPISNTAIHERPARSKAESTLRSVTYSASPRRDHRTPPPRRRMVPLLHEVPIDNTHRYADQPAPPQPITPDDEPLGPTLYDTGIDAREGLWLRSGWAGRRPHPHVLADNPSTPTRTTNAKTAEPPETGGSAVHDVLKHHSVREGGLEPPRP